MAALREKAVAAFKASKWFAKADGDGVAWGSMKALILEQVLPPQMESHEKDEVHTLLYKRRLYRFPSRGKPEKKPEPSNWGVSSGPPDAR